MNAPAVTSAAPALIGCGSCPPEKDLIAKIESDLEACRSVRAARVRYGAIIDPKRMRVLFKRLELRWEHLNVAALHRHAHLLNTSNTFCTASYHPPYVKSHISDSGRPRKHTADSRLHRTAIMTTPQKMVIVGAGPVGALAALYGAQRGFIVEVYELRPGMLSYLSLSTFTQVVVLI